MKLQHDRSITCALLLTCCLASLAMTSTAFGQDNHFATAKAEDVGLQDEALEELAQVVAGYVEKDFAIGGELVVIKDRKVVLHQSFGSVDKEDSRDWTNHTVCNIRSMTKPLTGAALQILIDRELVSIDDPVAKYLPEGFDNDQSRELTVKQVLTHRSGLPLTILEDVRQFPTLEAQVNATGEAGPEFEPDSKFWYSDAGTDVVGGIVEKVSGLPLNEFIEKELLEPLGMSETFYGIDGSEERLKDVASLYVGSPRAWVRFWTPKEEPFYPFAWGSQTLYSTTTDYAKFLALLMDEGKVGDKQILSKAAVERILTPVSEMTMLGNDAKFPTEFKDLQAYYGQMAVLYCDQGKPENGIKIFGHSGSDGTGAWAFPEQDLIVMYYTQSRGGVSVVRIERDLDRLLFNPDGYLATEEVPEKYRPFVGTFIANFASFRDEEFTVQVKDGKLALDIPSQMVFQLNEPDEDGKWAFAIAPAQIQLTFEKDDEGKVHLLKLHQAGQIFEVPRQGSALEAEMARKRAEEMALRLKVTVEEMGALEGSYADGDDEDSGLEVFIQDEQLCGRFPPGIVVHLETTKEKDLWSVKEDPRVFLRFQRNEDGEVTALVRIVGDDELELTRKQD